MSKRILFVDDSESIREMAAIALEVLGEYEVEQAADGLEAQRLLKAKPFDLVFTDLDMPGMGGDELIEWMKTEESTSDIPIVILTAGVDKIRQEIAAKYKVEAILKKPLDPMQLNEVARQVLAAPSAER